MRGIGYNIGMEEKNRESVADAEQRRREQEGREMFDYLMAQKGSLEDGYVFNRAEANAR